MKATRLRRVRTVSLVSLLTASLVAACNWDPSRPFDREAPQVNEALRAYDAGEAGAAADLLEDYLTTGGCSEGNIGTPLRVRERPNGTFDLGLTLFSIAERYGKRFGDEEVDAGPVDPSLQGLRTGQVDCALRVVRAIAEDLGQPPSLRARARYLEGNLLFMTAAYKEAVTAYDRALELVPAMGDAGPIRTATDGGADYGSPDTIGRDAAWNRAVALRRIEDKKDAGPDAAPPDGGGDGGKSDDNGDAGKNDQQKDGGNDDQNKDKDAGAKNDRQEDAGKDSGGSDEQQKPPPKKDEKDEPKEPPPPSRQSQDDRILDQLENAPTVDPDNAKQRGRARKVRGTADK